MIGAIDFEAASRAYWDQDEFVFLEDVLPRSSVDELLVDWENVRGSVYRSYVPGVRKAGIVGYTTLLARAPAITALYRSPALIDLVSRLCRKKLSLKLTDDDHACALYVYTRWRDGVRKHYDGCGCEENASYTVIVGLVDRSTSRFTCELFTREKGHERRNLSIATHPGSMAIFCGSKLLHGTTPLGSGEERVVLSLSYVTEGKQVEGVKRFTEDLKDSLIYFGPGKLRRWLRRE